MPGVHPKLHKASIDGMQSEIEELRTKLRRYEALRDGKI